MSRLTDLLAQAKARDARLGADLEREFRALSERRAFGLNFERHQPEAVELPGRPIRRGDKVRVLPPRGETARGDQRLWRVCSLDGDLARLESVSAEAGEVDAAVADLVVVAEFRDTIHPGLVSTGRVERGGDRPWHSVVNAENFHALKALTWTHRGRVDAIYIDPPYNSGASDWKYNNDYVNKDDHYRHSKWLAFMERRLELARELLNPACSVLIVTIDEKEYLRLGMLLKQTFQEGHVQMVSTVISPFGVARENELSRVDEYVFFVRLGSSSLGLPNNSRTILGREDESEAASEEVADYQVDAVDTETHWFSFMRAGSNSSRSHSPGCHYPIFATPDGLFHSVGDPLPTGYEREGVVAPRGTVALWPISTDGKEGVWQAAREGAERLFRNGHAKIGRFSRRLGRRSVTYLREGTIARLESGDLVLNDEGRIQVVRNAATSGRTVWAFPSHNATSHGTKLLSKILPRRSFPYPKSLFAVEDTLRVCVSSKPDAIILDFFAGSGTTAHAVMRLNRQDGGRRQCISVTNNEVAADEHRALRERGLRPGDPDWEAHGICDFITKPRIRAAIEGMTPDGAPIAGDYKFTDEFPMAEGFCEDAEFFTLTYENPLAVGHNRAFARIAPLLWMRAGSRGARIDTLPDTGWAVVETYGLLTRMDAAAAFADAIGTQPGLRIAYLVTDDDRAFQSAAAALPPGVDPVRLYESYLENFRFTSEA